MHKHQGDDFDKRAFRRREMLFYLVAVGILSIFLVLLQRAHPYFFLQDDNRDQYLPYFVHNFRALLHGDIALFNFHQYLGTAHLANGNAAALYPMSWLSVLLSQWMTGTPFAAIDITVSLHLLIGAAGFFRMMRGFGVDRFAALFGAITWPLVSFFFYIGNSWYVATGPVAYLPWMIALSLSLFECAGRCSVLKAFLPLVFVRVLLVFVGHPQFFVYAFIFEVLTVQTLLVLNYISGKDGAEAATPIRRRMNSFYWLSIGVTFLMAAPLLLPMWDQMDRSFRGGVMRREMFFAGGTVLDLWFKGLVDPYGGHVFQSISFAGIACLAFGVIALLYALARMAHIAVSAFAARSAVFSRSVIRPRQVATVLVLAALGVFAFLWAGNLGVSELIYRIPLLNRFRWHYKLLIEFYLFLVAVSSFGVWIMSEHIDKMLQKWVSPLRSALMVRGLIAALILVQLVQFGVLYYKHPVRALRIHREEVPWSEPLTEVITQGRILSVGFDYRSEYTAHTLGFNYATLWGLDHFAGYEAMPAELNARATIGAGVYSGYFDDWNLKKSTVAENIERFRRWGVRWYVVHPAYEEVYGELPFKKILTQEKRVVYEDTEAAALVYFEQDKKRLVPYEYAGNTLVIKTDQAEGGGDRQLIVNFLYHPSFRATADGRNIAIERDGDRMSVSVPEGAREIRIRYSDRLFICGVWIACLTLICVIIFMGLPGRLPKRLIQKAYEGIRKKGKKA